VPPPVLGAVSATGECLDNAVIDICIYVIDIGIYVIDLSLQRGILSPITPVVRAAGLS
jgi:hypothetical protein